MKKVVIAGGGLAGLTAAVYLLQNNYNVTLLEASPKPGGRASAFYFREQNTMLDNGQHILMGCYKYSLDLLETIGSLNNLPIPKNLEVNFVARNNNQYKLATPANGYPLNILAGLLGYNYFSNSDKLSVIKFFSKLFFTNTNKLRNLSADQWLKKNKQSERTIKGLWEILIVGALNTSLANASAETFARVLKEIFFTGNSSTKILVPDTNLLTLFGNPAVEYIRSNSGNINFSEKVTEIESDEDKIIKIVTNKSSYTDFDYFISAIPLHAWEKIEYSSLLFNEIQMEYSPILSVHIFLKNNCFKKSYYGLIDSPVQWVFNHDSFISLVTSNPEKYIDLPKEEILRIFADELATFFNEFHPNDITGYKVIKEKRATFIPDTRTEFLRTKLNSYSKNLILSGDWTNTALPSTIESAIKSGKKAAEAVLAK